jgi:hypothetical protein
MNAARSPFDSDRGGFRRDGRPVNAGCNVASAAADIRGMVDVFTAFSFFDAKKVDT